MTHQQVKVQLAEANKMSFSDLVKRLASLEETPVAPPNDDEQQVPPNQQVAQPNAQPNTAEKPIPGQQPNLGPKSVTPLNPMASTKPVGTNGVQTVPGEPQAQQQGIPTGLAAAILQAVNANKQQAQLAPTTSQSVAQQQANAVKPMQQTAKPGEPTEEDVNEWGEWWSKKKPEQSTKPADKVELDDEKVKQWANKLSLDPNYVTHPNWANVSNASKQKIVDQLKKNDPVSYDYLEKANKVREYKRSKEVDPKELERLEQERDASRKTWSSTDKSQPKTTTTPTTPPSGEKKTTPPTDEKKTTPPAGEKKTTEPTKTEPKKATVSAAELQKFRDEMGNQNITLGQYLNYKQGLTARKGSANDPDVIQKQLGDKEVAWDPTKKDTTTVTPATVDPQKITPVTVDATANTEKATDQSTTAATTPAKPVAASDKDKKPTDWWKAILNPKTMPDGKVVMDPFRTTSASNTDNPAKKTGPAFEPGEGPSVREPVPVKQTEVKEELHIQLESLVNEMIQEDATTAALGKLDSVSKAIPPGVKTVGKVAGKTGLAGLGALGAIGSAADAYDRYQRGDTTGAILKGVGAVGDVVSMIPSPWTVGGGMAVSTAADWAADKFGKPAPEEEKTKEEIDSVASEELGQIVKLSKHKVENK